MARVGGEDELEEVLEEYVPGNETTVARVGGESLDATPSLWTPPLRPGRHPFALDATPSPWTPPLHWYCARVRPQPSRTVRVGLPHDEGPPRPEAYVDPTPPVPSVPGKGLFPGSRCVGARPCVRSPSVGRSGHCVCVTLWRVRPVSFCTTLWRVRPMSCRGPGPAGDSSSSDPVVDEVTSGTRLFQVLLEHSQEEVGPALQG